MKSSSPHLIYIANIRFPTNKAHGVHIAHMASELGRRAPTTLITTNRHTEVQTSIHEYYGTPVTYDHQPITVTVVGQELPLHRLGFALQSFLFGWRAAQRVRRIAHAPHTTVISRDSIPLFFIHLFTRLPFIYEAHNSSGSWLTHYISRRAARIVVISEGLKEYFCARGIAAEKITVLRDGYDPAAFVHLPSQTEARTRLGLPLEKTIVVYPGHLYSWKGVDTLAEAAGMIAQSQQRQKNQKPIEFYFVGGTKRHIAEFKARHAGVPNIHLIGHQPPHTIPLYMAAADIGALPNSATEAISRHYTSPLKLFEYMAARCPIVASDIPSIREIVNDSQAFFFPADNAQALARTIEYMAAHPDEMAERAQQAYAHVQQFSWPERAKEYVQLAEAAAHNTPTKITLASHSPSGALSITYITPTVHPHSGYGRMAQKSIEGLSAQGAHVYTCLTPMKNWQSHIVQPFRIIKEVIAHRTPRHTKKIIHVLEVWPFAIWALPAALLTRRPLYINGIGTYSVPAGNIIKRTLMRYALHYAQSVICISHYTAKRIQQGLGGVRARLEVIHLGTDPLPALTETQRQQYAAQYASIIEHCGAPLVLTVGAIKDRKSQLDTLKAVQLLRQKPEYKAASYVMVGSLDYPGYAESIRSYAAAHGMADAVHIITDAHDDTALAWWYEQADVFALNSTSDNTHFEGFGLVYIEANNAGLPTVGSLDTGAEDAIASGVSGYVAPSRNPTAIATALEKALTTITPTKARAWAAKFSWTTMAQKYIEIFQRP
jgi:glycosyltransferase involved in cell wall biosynthesis